MTLKPLYFAAKIIFDKLTWLLSHLINHSQEICQSSVLSSFVAIASLVLGCDVLERFITSYILPV